MNDELAPQHKAVWDVIRANAEAIAESSRDEWGDLCAVAADLADDCDPNLARDAIVEAVAAVNALPELVAENKRLREALKPLAELAPWLRDDPDDDTREVRIAIRAILNARAALGQEGGQ